MRTSIISYDRALENDLARRVMEEMNLEDDALGMLEGDPDQLRIEGYTVLFTDLEDKDSNTRTVIYCNHSDCDEDIVVQMLQEFYEEDEDGRELFKNHFETIESTRDNMTALETGIAYRGGRGYTFALHKYRDNNKLFN